MMLNDPGAKSVTSRLGRCGAYGCNKFPPGLTFMLERERRKSLRELQLSMRIRQRFGESKSEVI